MKIIDRYIVRKFLGMFIFTISLLMLVSIVFDVSEKVDDFLRSNAPLKAILFDYYVNFVIHYGNMFSFLFIFIAVIFVTSKMAQRTEIIAILSSGVSFPRMMWPYFVGATILAAFFLFLNHFVVPRANETRLEFESEYISGPYRIKAENLHMQVAPNKFVYLEDYRSYRNRGDHFALEEWEDGALKYKMFADRAEWDSSAQQWNFKRVFLRRFRGDKEIIREVKKLDTAIGFRPVDMKERVDQASAMTYQELNHTIQQELEKGSDDVVHFQIEKYQRTAFPMATYVLTLLGVSIGSRKVRGGMGLHIALGFFLAILYIFSMKITKVAATNAGMEPVIAVWIPNIIFLGISLLVYRLAPK